MRAREPATTGRWHRWSGRRCQSSLRGIRSIGSWGGPLAAAGLKPTAAGDPATLVRRLAFDLTGLPPEPDMSDGFVADPSPAAFAALVDELLASPHYGEHWGRHWLDVVRYADSNGLDENVAHGNAWRYRDYVIAAFNADKPFDAFVREQIAGDLLVDDETSP